MGSEQAMTWRDGRMAAVWRSLLVTMLALAWIAASGNAHAAKKDTSMCSALTGAAKGLCTAAASLGCGEETKHQKQCDALGDKFEALTGDTPPWEVVEPPPPPPPTGQTVTLAFDFDAFDLETGTPCRDALGAACNGFDTEFILQPNDFFMAFDAEQADHAVLVPVLTCGSTEFVVGIALVPGETPYELVDEALAQTLEYTDNPLEIAMGPGNTIVLRTCDLGYFKIGNVTVDGNSVTISYDELDL